MPLRYGTSSGSTTNPLHTRRPWQPVAEATLTHCGGEAAVTFRTSDLGGALDEVLVGRTYAVALGEARFVSLEGVALLGGLLTQDIPTVSPQHTEINMMGASRKRDAVPRP